MNKLLKLSKRNKSIVKDAIKNCYHEHFRIDGKSNIINFNYWVELLKEYINF